MRHAFVLLMLLSLALAACGGGDDDDDNDSTPATVSESSTGTVNQGTAERGTATTQSAQTTETVSGTRPSGGTPSPGSGAATSTPRQATNVSTPRPIATATEQVGKPTPTDEALPTPQATPTPSEEVDVVITPGGDASIELLDIGFGQAEGSDEVGYGFVVRNNTGDTLDYSEYDIVAYDAAGEPLDSTFGFIDLLLPGETRGIGGSIYVPEGTTASRVEVQITSGDPTTSDFPQLFTTSNAAYFADEFSATVTAVISSPYSQPVEDLDIHILLYNGAGDIIGGGSWYIDFVLPGQPTGTEVYVASSEAPDHIEVYAVVSSLTAFTQATGQQPSVLQSGWGMSPNGFDAGYGAIVENPNGGMIVDYLRYQAIAYNAEGQVLTIDSSYISGLFAGERFGIGGSVYPPEGTTVDRVEFQVLASAFIDSTMTNPLSVSDVAFVGDEFSPTVTGTVSSSFATELDSVETHAIAYNGAGEIIGGGWSFTDDPVASGGTAPAEVIISVSEVPASVELYATPANLLDVVP